MASGEFRDILCASSSFTTTAIVWPYRRPLTLTDSRSHRSCVAAQGQTPRTPKMVRSPTNSRSFVCLDWWRVSSHA
jgi:hypothetical protein